MREFIIHSIEYEEKSLSYIVTLIVNRQDEYETISLIVTAYDGERLKRLTIERELDAPNETDSILGIIKEFNSEIVSLNLESLDTGFEKYVTASIEYTKGKEHVEIQVPVFTILAISEMKTMPIDVAEDLIGDDKTLPETYDLRYKGSGNKQKCVDDLNEYETSALERMLADAIRDENYEKADEIQIILDKRKEQ